MSQNRLPIGLTPDWPILPYLALLRAKLLLLLLLLLLLRERASATNQSERRERSSTLR